MAPVLRDKSLPAVYVTIRPRVGAKGQKSKSMTVYGATVAEVAELVREAIKSTRSRKAAS